MLVKQIKDIYILDWKTQHSKDNNSLQISMKVNVIPIKISGGSFRDIGKFTLKFKSITCFIVLHFIKFCRH